MHSKVAGLLVLICLAGCNGKDAPKGYAKTTHPGLFFKSLSIDTEAAEKQQRSAEFLFSGWATYFGRWSNTVTLVVVPGETFYYPGVGMVAGIYSGAPKGMEVIVAAGSYNTLPAFWHELCHLNRVSSHKDSSVYGYLHLDPNHVDPRWTNEWEWEEIRLQNILLTTP